MAKTRSVEVRVAVDANHVGRGVRKAERELNRLSRSTTGAGRAFAALGGVAKTTALVGLAGVAAAAAVGFERLKKQERASAITANTLRNMGGAAALNQKQIEGMARSLAMMTGVEASTIQGAENILVGFKSIGGNAKTFSKILQISLDRSAKSGRDLTATARAIGLAFNDPIGGMMRLARAGIFLDSATKDQIKTLAKAGQIEQARAVLLEKIGKGARGAAKEIGETLTGRVARAKEAFGQMAEEITAALAPALLALMPPIMAVMRALTPVIKELADGLGKVVSDLMNNSGFREFAKQVETLAIGALRGLIGALQAVLPIVGTVAGALGGLLGAITGNSVGVLALSAAFGALALGAVAAKVAALTATFRELAAVQRTVAFMSAMSGVAAGLGSSVSVLAAGLQRTSAASVGLAPGLTAAAAGMTRFSAAGSIAKTALSSIGPALLSLAGGPVGAAVLGIGALVGGVVALASGMFRGETASEAYARAMNDVRTASDAARDAIDRVRSSVIGQAQASLDLKEANARVAAAARDLAAAERSGNPAAIRAARAALTRAELEAASAKDRLIGANRQQAQSFADLKTKISDLPGKISAQNSAFKNMLPGLRLGAMANSDLAKQYGKVRSEYAQNLKKPKALEDVRKDALATADALKNVHTPAAKEAREALLKLGNAKIGKGGSIAGLQGLVDNAVAKLDALNSKTSGAKSKSTSNLKNIGAGAATSVSGNMNGILSAVQTVGQQIIDEAKRVHEKASEELAQTGKRSVPVVPSVRNNMRAVSDTVRVGGKAMVENARVAHDRTSAILAKVASNVRGILNAGDKKQDSARNKKFSEVFANRAPNITSRLSADTFQRDKGTTGNVGIRLVKSRFSQLQDELDGAMKAIDTTLDSALKSIDSNLNDQGDAIEKALKGALVDNLDAIIPKYAEKVRSIKAQADVLKTLETTLTEQEQALKNFDATASADNLATAITDAQAKLDEARNYGSAADVVEAERALGEAQRAQQRANLEAAAQQSRVDRDREIEEKRTAIEADAEWVRTKIATDAENLRIQKQADAEADRVQQQQIFEARRLEMEAELARMEAQFVRIPALLKSNKAGARAELIKIRNMFSKWGGDAGGVYVDELTGALDAMGPALAKKLAKAVTPYLKLGSPAKEGPLSTLDEWFTPFVPTLVGGIDMTDAERTASGIAGMLSPSATGGFSPGGTTIVNVTVNGNEFSARDFARKLQPELDRIIKYSGV